jgi:hypothetical protein
MNARNRKDPADGSDTSFAENGATFVTGNRPEIAWPAASLLVA